jgi:hypothetical protein
MLAITLMPLNFATAAPENVIYVDPPVVWDTEYDIGDTLTVEIKVDYVESLWSYQFELAFNPDVLEGVSVSNGDFLGSAIPPPLRPLYILEFPGPGFDNVAGTLGLYGCAIKLQPPPPPFFFPTGSGVLATVTFEVVGEGISGIVLGPQTALFDPQGNELPPMSTHGHGLFINTENAPELYIRTRGAHGGGVWPEWHVGLVGELQTMYCRIMNYGEQSAEVKVVFTVVYGMFPKMEFPSDIATIDAATWISEDIVPGELVVSASFMPPGPEIFYISAKLYLGTEEYPYELIEGLFGGVGVSRDPATKCKVVT